MTRRLLRVIQWALAVAFHGSASTEELVRTCSSLPTCVASQSRVTTDILDVTQRSEASASLLGPLNGKFIYKNNKDGTINKNAVICSFCKKKNVPITEAAPA